jgi:hypothetical protein
MTCEWNADVHALDVVKAGACCSTATRACLEHQQYIAQHACCHSPDTLGITYRHTAVPARACACRPNNAEDYVHRIGRTGRAGATGTSYSFFTAANGRLARDISKIMREANQVVPPALDQLAATSSGGGASE